LQSFFILKPKTMKKITTVLFFLFSVFAFAQPQTITYSISPTSFEETTSITVTVNGSSVNEATWGIVGNALYIWTWSFDINDANILDCPTNGTWIASNEVNRFIYDSSTDTYTKTFVPATFYNRTNIGRIGFLVKAKNGTGDKKSQDILAEVGLFQASLLIPSVNSTTIIASGGSRNVSASNTNGVANYNLKANGVSIDSDVDVSSYSFDHTGITENQNYELEITQGTTTLTKKFAVIVTPPSVSLAIPPGKQDGINYDPNDPTKAILVLDAPGKDYVYVAGSFNNWQPNASYSMRKDVSSSKFWLELIGLTPGVDYSYQYWVVDNTPVANSPVLVKTADPYSTLVLSSFDDPFTSPTVYPNLPPFPVASGQEREVTVLKTGQTPYPWSAATTNFVKPSKDALVVYEVLVRDFDTNRSYQNLINKIDYFKNLKINAIELMPIMEFDGNESWGYNTGFHLANDKAYGPADKLKEFIDLCHQNGIAVILDVALNHAFGRNPMNRMWMNDPDGDGWGGPSSDNPYFNVIGTHSYGVGNDFNHSQPRTKNYVKRVVKHWIEEYKIDGFRWDLTKGFTQNCTGSDACTNGYQQDRVDVLKEYADYSWSLDPTHYVIFEHLGIDSEEQQWANHRINETPSKGVMMWGKMTDQYNQLSMGFNSSNDITRMGHVAHGFSGKRNIGYAESHDEERLMYKNVTFGNNTNASHNVRTLNTALSRMSALGAVSLLVPGPKMIWHFGELGWDSSIYTCANGTLNTNTDATAGDCKLDNKPQVQWQNGSWLLNSTARAKIYNDWSKMINLKKSEPVFSGNYAINSGTTLTPKVYIFDDAIPITQLKNVVVLSNFNVNATDVVPNFPYTGIWYDLMDNSTINVTDVAAPINIAAGQFKIYGNKAPTNLANEAFEFKNNLSLSPNPTSNYFTISGNTSKVLIYSITGQLVKTFEKQTSEYQFSINELNKGIYFIKTIDDNNREKTIKLIKQ
jgi:1,4-alpha-glucan branching enzyme